MCCKEPSNHEKKWYFSLPSNDKEDICLACVVLSLEDKQLLNVRKKIILHMLHEILHGSPQIIVNIVQHEDQVSSHIAMVLLGFCCGTVEHLVKPSTDCLLLFLIHMKKEELRLAVAQKLTVEIQQECNYVQCLPHFSLLGRLFQLFPELIREFLNKKSQFIPYVASGMNHPSEEVRSTIVYIFLQIYSSDFSVGNGGLAAMDSYMAKGILFVLKSGLTKDIIKNGLALLKIFISQDSKKVSLLFENLNEDWNFMAVIKKIILTCDAAFQACIIQCICYVLSEPAQDIHIRKLIEENVPELLFEVISENNELLLETILCCLLLFTRCSHFFEKCHVLYSVSTILDATVRLLDLKNMKLLSLAFNLLISLISSDQYLMATSTQTSLFQQALQLIEKTYKIHNPQVLLSANKLLFYLLKKESFSSLKFPLPLGQLCDTLHICLKNVQRFLFSHLLSTSQFRKSFESGTEDLPLEVKILTNGLDIIYLFMRILKQHDSNPMNMEEIFSCPVIQNQNKLSKSRINFQSVMQTFIDALDETFVPSCLLLGSTTIIGKIAWCHLINVLSAAFENPIDDLTLTLFVKKLIKSNILNYVWNLKVDDISSPDLCFGKSKDVCNLCLKNILILLMHKQQVSADYLNNLEDGIIHLNGSIEESVSVLSLKFEPQTQNVSHLHAMQSTFLCLVYNSYFYEGPIMNMKNMIPHLIYYVTCNLDRLYSAVVNVKHLLFILAICMYETMNKIQTGLIEVSGMLWDVLSKTNSPGEVYTHHKVLLWWCFKNQEANLFSSYVLQIWLEFSQHTMDTFISLQATKILVNLLTTNNTAQETFLRQFESNPEIRFSFLKKAFDTEIFESEDLITKERFEKLIQCCVHHLQICLSKILIMKNHKDLSKESFLSVGFEWLLWCQQKINNTNSPVDVKLVFHVTSYCCNSLSDDRTSLIPCLKYLQYAVKVQSEDSKAWHIITGNANIVSFLQKSLTLHEQFEIEVLHLLILIIEHQILACLKSNSNMPIPFAQIIKWMNCPHTKILSMELINHLLDVEFKGLFIQICSLDHNMLLLEQTLSRNDLRILAIYLQNALMLGNPVVEKIALASYKKMLKYIAKTDSYLENHIMLQPWLRILLESRLDDLPNSKDLFENWCNFNKENVALIGVMNRFANRILDLPNIEMHCKLLNLGAYKKFISQETILKLKEMAVPDSSCDNTQESNLILEIENFVADHISKISSDLKNL